jgi:uncharacterized protein (TIGR03437 family)
MPNRNTPAAQIFTSFAHRFRAMIPFVLTIAGIASFGLTIQAAPITYTLTTTASGTLGASTFTNATVTVTLSGDISGITAGTGSFSGALINTGNASVTIGGLGTATFTNPIVMASTYNALFPALDNMNAVIVLDSASGTGILLQAGTVFSGYGLGLMAPVTGTGGVGSGSHMVPTFPTTKGNLTWSVGQALGTSTFTASTTTTTAPGTTTNITLNLTQTNQTHSVPNQFSVVETGSVGSLGPATLSMSSTPAIDSNANFVAPILFTATLYFNQADSIVAVFMDNDVNFLNESPLTLSGGTITDGTGAYAGAFGSLSLNFTMGANNVYTTTGSGSVTVGSKTTPLTLTNFHGGASCSPCTEEFNNTTVTGTVAPFGNVTLALSTDVTNSPPQPKVGFGNIPVNATDSINVFTPKGFNNLGDTVTETIAGGTGAFAGATGSFTLTLGQNSAGVGIVQGSGTITTAAKGAPVITSVKTAFGQSVIADNTWLQINGTNLAPSNTPSAGVVWSSAPSFTQGMMPAQLGPISVTVNGLPGYIFFYCSASTDAACTAGDQINVLSPVNTSSSMYPAQVVVTNNGVSSAPFTVLNNGYSPTFPLFDATGHVVARHLDFTFLGPTSLGFATPAKAGETIILVLYGLGLPTGTPPVVGSATQSGSLPATPVCWVSGFPAKVVGVALISPGLYQLNLTLPSGISTGDNPVSCNYQGYPTSPGALIAVQ